MKQLHDVALSVLTTEYRPYSQVKADFERRTGLRGAYLILTGLVDAGLAEQRIETVFTSQGSFSKGIVSSFRLRRAS